MISKSLFLAALLGMFSVPTLWAQGHGAGGMQGGQRQQGMSGMQRGQNQSPGMGAQLGQQNRQRMRVHATQQQQQQYRTCTQSMERVRSRIREMARLSKSQPLNREQAQQLHQQLRNELQTMQQQREQLMTGLDQEQKAAVQNRAQQMNQAQMDLDSFSEALGFELNQVDPNRDKVREQVRNLERSSKQLQQQQREVAEEAGIQ